MIFLFNFNLLKINNYIMLKSNLIKIKIKIKINKLTFIKQNYDK